MTQSIIAAEAMALLVSAIIFYGNIFETTQHTPKRRAFGLVLLVNAIAMAADMLSWLLDGNTAAEPLTYTLTLLSMVLSFAVSAAFVHFIHLHLLERRAMSALPFRMLIVFSLAAMVVVTLACLRGHIFSFVNGAYADGSYYNIYLAANSVSLLSVLCAICLSARYLGKHDCIATLSYLVLPMIAVLINAMYPDFSMAYPATTLSLLINYVMMGSEHENVLILQEQATTHRAVHDEMTNLLNRRAYTETSERLVQESGNVGVVFCDINGLKYTNDHSGHTAGDKLICTFAEILQTCFRREEIYRISGDEFVVLMPSVSQEILDARAGALCQQLNTYEVPIAAVGSAFGAAPELHDLVKTAEERMYLEKQNFYQRFPIYRR